MIPQRFRAHIRFYIEAAPHHALNYQILHAFEDKPYIKFTEGACPNSVTKNSFKFLVF